MNGDPVKCHIAVTMRLLKTCLADDKFMDRQYSGKFYVDVLYKVAFVCQQRGPSEGITHGCSQLYPDVAPLWRYKWNIIFRLSTDEICIPYKFRSGHARTLLDTAMYV